MVVRTKEPVAMKLAMLGLTLLLLSGCSLFGDDGPSAPASDPAPASAQLPDDDYDPEAPVVAKPPAKESLRNDIVALVNDQPISVYDLDQRIALILVTSNLPDTAEMRKKVREQALDQLQTELIQRQEAQKNDITVSTPEVNKRIEEIVGDSNISQDQLKEILAHGHVTMASFRAQIANQLLWQKTVMMMFSNRFNIAPETVDAELARVQASADKAHFAVSEIFIAVDNPEQDAKAKKDIQGLYDQLRAGAPFQAIARQFSQSPSAAQGGSIGVIYDGQLSPELNKVLATMKTGDISEPIRATGGYYILALHQRYEPAGTKIEETRPEDRVLPPVLPLARLLLPLGPNPPKKLIENAMEVAGTLAQRVPDCKAMAQVAKNIQGSQFMDLGQTRLADMSAQIRDVLAKTEPGRVAQPFMSAAGVELIARCDKAIPKLKAFPMPTREQIEQQLSEEQISAMARRYSRDLKRDANIETR